MELAHHLRRGAAVERALEGADGAADGAGQIGAGRDDDAAGERGGVQAVLGADDEVGVQGAGRGGIRVLAVELLQEAARQRELGVRLDGLEALAQAVEGGQRRGREGRQLAGLVDGRRPVRPAPRAPDGDGGPQRVHRVGVARQLAQRAHDRLRDLGRNQLRASCATRRSRAARPRGRRCPSRPAVRSGSRDTAAGPFAPSTKPMAVSAAMTPCRPGEYGRSAGALGGLPGSRIRLG